MTEIESQVKSRERVEKHGEVLTARREVNAMLDLVKSEASRIESRFLEPACGTGNFLIAILERKLDTIDKRIVQKGKQLKKAEKVLDWKKAIYDMDSLTALTSLYGIDILEDNVNETRDRLRNYYIERYQQTIGCFPSKELVSAAEAILECNILLGDAIHNSKEVTVPGVPGLDQIVFTEWGRIDEDFKRREFRYEYMSEDGVEKKKDEKPQQMLLFDDEPQKPRHDVLATDDGREIYKPAPIREYPLIHFSKLKKTR